MVPSAHVDQALTRKVANLARLELTDREVELFTQQIGDVLKYVDQLQKVDVSGVEPLTHPLESAAPLREDTVLPPRPTFNDGFRVPRVI